MIERILGLKAKFEVHLLAQLELLPQRQIRGERRRAADAAQRSRSIAQREIVRALENGVIHKVVVHPIRAMIASGRPHDVGSLGTIRGQRITVCNGESQRTSIGDSPDAIRLPSADDRLRPSRHAPQECPPAAKRQIVAVAELNHIGDVERRQTPFLPRLVRILQARETAQPGHIVVGLRGVIDRLRPCERRQEL